MKKIIICFLILFLSSNSAYAIYGGTDASGDKNVITFSIGKDSRNSYCSGALISENIAVTAAHCLQSHQQMTDLQYLMHHHIG
jgi:hypothetical protein